MDKPSSSVAALADKLKRLKMNNNLVEPKARLETKLSPKKSIDTEEDPISEAYTPAQMSLPNNDQTWLYCEDKSKINVVVDLTEFLTIRPISHSKKSTDSAIAGGGIDTRTFVRPKKQILLKQCTQAAVSICDNVNSCDETNNQDSWASLETNVKFFPDLQPTHNHAGGVSSIEAVDSRERDYIKKTIPITHKKEQNRRKLDSTFDYNQNSKSENQNNEYFFDAQGDGMDVKSPKYVEDVESSGNDSVTIRLNSTFSKIDGIDSLDQKPWKEASLALTQQYLEELNCPLNASPLNTTYDKVIDTSPKLTECKEVNKSGDSSSYSTVSNSSEERDNPVFHPVSVSTPTRSKSTKQNINNAVVTESDISSDDSQTLCDSQHNISLPINATVTGSLDGRNIANLSKSDPSILDSLEVSGRTYGNGSSVKSDRRQSLYNSKRAEQSKLNTTFDKKSAGGQSSVESHEEDSTSSTSDSSYKSCLSSKRTHLRSLGDVRTLARQQEESLRLQPENQLKSKQLQLNSGIVRSHESVAPLKKVMSEDVIYPSSSESYGLSRLARTTKSAHSSTLNLNNNFGAYSSAVPSKAISTSKTMSRTQSTSRNENTKFQGSGSVASVPIPRRNPLSKIPLIASQIPRPGSRIPKPSSRQPPNRDWQDGCF